MTAEQRTALVALKQNYSYIEDTLLALPRGMGIDCYRGTLDLKRVGTAIIHANGFVDWYRA